MRNEAKVCGTGAACEAYCPLVRVGRDCPDIDDMLSMADMAGITPSELLSLPTLQHA